MPIPYLIIDGYNLMHAVGIARARYGPGDLQKCRRQLQALLARELDISVRRRATVVYDAFDSPSDDNRVFYEAEMTIMYAPKGHDADGEIERLLLQHSAPKQVIVVSSDHRLHKAARRRKAACVDSEDFAETLAIEDGSLESAGQHRPTSSYSKPSSIDEHFDADYLLDVEKELRRKP